MGLSGVYMYQHYIYYNKITNPFGHIWYVKNMLSTSHPSWKNDVSQIMSNLILLHKIDNEVTHILSNLCNSIGNVKTLVLKLISTVNNLKSGESSHAILYEGCSVVLFHCVAM